MKIGCCLPGGSFMPQGVGEITTTKDILLAGYRAVKAAGYDYAETSVGMVMKLTDEEFAELVELHKAGEFTIETCNSFIPATYQVTDPAQLPALEEFVTKAMGRMAALGVEFVVFGSGGARKMPMVDTMAELAAIDEFLKMCDRVGEKTGNTVVIEPLNKGETNIFNSVSAGASLVRRLNLPHVKLLADAFHMLLENDNLLSIEENADILCHTHLASGQARLCPSAEGDEYLADFGKHLQAAGYTHRVSIECRYKDFVKDIAEAYPFMRKTYA